MKRLLAVLVAPALLLSGCGEDQASDDDAGSPTSAQAAPQQTSTPVRLRSRNVSRADFGDAWPLTVASGRVNCSPAGGGPAVNAVFTTNGGKLYALNGTAKAYLDLPGIDPIWADNPDVDGLKKDISVLTDICVG